MNLPFTFKTPIILGLLKMLTVKFTIYSLTILTYSLKLYVIGKKIFYNPEFFRIGLSS